MISIRPLGPDQVEAMIRLWEQAGLSCRPAGRDHPEALTAQIDSEGDLFLGAFAGPEGRLVGAVVGSIDGRRKGWVNRLAIHPEFRRRGVARRLLAEIEARLVERGALLVTALIELENEASLALFRATGYQETQGITYFRKLIVPGA
jgi:ribosomal protein S18 acetylase RimI-like enzyme